uniref:SJCHGC00483 protein n=1 Tax=Schistosoma japonicum TaxID=6182 RepID=Q5DAP3_SCHJA|nr:SJCHGC00483 protein [Schistosoma japonicum]
MTDHRHSHGRNKLYFLRLRRFCQFILNLARNGFYEGWMGKESYLTLNTAEDFRLLHSEKARIICAMWYLLSRHKFKEAARLLAHSIHKYPISPTWLWRVAFHIFQCHRDDIGLRSFNRVLDAFLLSDENNRILEFILYEISKGNLDTVQFCRTNKQLVQRNKYSINHAVLTREPEFTHVQRLQRLYEGYGFYGMWLKKLIHLH